MRDGAESEAFLTQAFAGLNEKSKGRELPMLQPDWNAPKVAEVSDISAQSLIMLKSLGVPRLDDDFYPLLLADYVFGGAGLSSRLSLAVRENEGLTYGIYSFLTSDDTGDFWQIYFSTTPDNTARIFELLNQEYEKFYREGISPHELDVAKSSLLSSFNLRFSSVAVIADMLEQMQVQKLGIDFLKNRQNQVEAVTLEQVNDAIRRRLPKTLKDGDGARVFEIVGAARKNN